MFHESLFWIEALVLRDAIAGTDNDDFAWPGSKYICNPCLGRFIGSDFGADDRRALQGEWMKLFDKDAG